MLLGTIGWNINEQLKQEQRVNKNKVTADMEVIRFACEMYSKIRFRVL